MFYDFPTGRKEGTMYTNALQELFTHNYQKVYKIAYTIILNKELAEEATQEAFTKAFLYINSLHDKSKFSAWIGKITANVCNDILKEEITKRSNSVTLYSEGGQNVKYVEEIPDTELPATIYEDKEFRKKLYDCINSLFPEDRKIIVLKLLYECSYSEIAKKMKINENTIKTKIRRAKLKIKKEIIHYLSGYEY